MADVNGPTLSIVMPALNEEAGIARAIAAARRCGDHLMVAGLVRWFQIVVVDDGSQDRTGAELARLVEEHSELIVCRHDRNRGLGAALRTGFAAADGELVFYTDADLPVDLDMVGVALDLLGDDVDAVSAFRTRRRGEGARRFLYSLGYNGLCRVALGLRVRDANFAAKLLRSEQLQDLELHSEGSFIDAELLARIQRSGGRIVQFPAEYHPRSRGVSTLSSTRVIAHILREMYLLGPSIRRTNRRSAATV